jgi:sensor c-di-GMP phosphodiesterase-like protein
MSNMSVQAPPQAPRKPAILSDALHLACALGAGLIPLTVFVVLSYYQTIRRAEADLTEIAGLALQLAQDILQEAELQLTRFVNVSGGRATPESERLLRAIVYTDPYFREARIIDERGFLIHSTVAPIDLPIEIPADQRADPSIESLQVIGLQQTPLMREKSIVLALPTEGQGEVDLLVDPALVSLFFHEVDLGPRGYLALTGPKGRVLSVLGPPPPTEAIAALTPDPDRIRVTLHNGQTWAVAEVDRDWALRDWFANLLFSIPVAAVASAALAFIVIRLIRRQMGLDHDLRLAIGRGELKVEYQPIIDLDNGRCVAAEALLRWRHPVHGYVRPDVFIPIAEETGLIGPLTEWLVRRVILEQRPVLDRFPDLRLSINCTSSLLVSRDLEQILRSDVVPPDLATSLVFEVTENVFLGQNANSAREAMSRLRGRGFRFALDDFGAGYSSLGYLQTFEFEFLKIDRSFVQAIGSSNATSPIFDALVDLARKLDIVTVAEGVETEEQRRYVDRRGVPLAQGWLFAMPLPVGEFMHFLAAADSLTPVEGMPQQAGEPRIWASDGRAKQGADHRGRL